MMEGHLFLSLLLPLISCVLRHHFRFRLLGDFLMDLTNLLGRSSGLTCLVESFFLNKKYRRQVACFCVVLKPFGGPNWAVKNRAFPLRYGEGQSQYFSNTLVT